MLDITHVLAPGRAGGLERVVEMLAIAQVRHGHRVTAVAIRPAGAPVAPVVSRLAQNGVDVVGFDVRRRAYGEERRGFREMLRPRPRGVVHTHGYRADVIYAPVASALGFPIVTTLHGFTGGNLKNRLYELLQRRACRRFDQVVAVSSPIAARMRKAGVPDQRLHTIQNAFHRLSALETRADSRQRLGLGGDRFILGWVGRMSREKGADVLVDALPALSDLPVLAVFVGEGPELLACQARARALGVESMIRWAGPVDGMGDLFRALDAFVLSSRTEGTPIVLFEAMAAEVPIVATSVGGVPDVLRSNEATLVASESPAALAAAVRSMLTDLAATAERAQRAKRAVEERFSPEGWVSRYDDVYRAALAQPR